MNLRSAGWTSDFAIRCRFIPQNFAAPLQALVLRGVVDGG
jgi:hypothetical protein